VTASDGIDTATESSVTTVANRAPGLNFVDVNSTLVSDGDVVTCTVYASEEDANDWMTYSVALTNQTDNVLKTRASAHALFSLQGLVDPGDKLRCDVKVCDLSGICTEGSGGEITVNTPPSVAVTLSPSRVASDGTLTCSVDASDPDTAYLLHGFLWTDGDDNVVQSTPMNPASTDSFDVSALAKGQNITCEAAASDLIDHSASDTATSYVNTPPEVSVAIEEGDNTEILDTEVTCLASWDDADSDEVTISYSWSTSVLGIFATTAAVDLTEYALTDGDVLTCTATPSDLTESGPPGEATTTVHAPLVLACPTVGSAVIAGSMDASAIDEASGLVASRTHDAYWVHNDSGDSARIFALDSTGKRLATVSLQGASARDWEDMSMGPGPTGGDWLYIGDIGDNGLSRGDVHIYRMPEPAVQDASVSNWEKLSWTYEDGAHNAEGLFVDPVTGDAYVVTKTSGPAQLYRVEAPLMTGQVLKKVASVDLSPLVTAADISADGSYIGMRTYSTALIWVRQDGVTVIDAMSTTPCSANLTYEPQGETFAFKPDRSGYTTISEGAYSKVHTFELQSN
jgi:hypothetical protein